MSVRKMNYRKAQQGQKAEIEILKRENRALTAEAEQAAQEIKELMEQQEQQEERYKNSEKKNEALLLKVEDLECTGRISEKMIGNLNGELSKQNEKLLEQINAKRNIEEEKNDLREDIRFMRLQRTALLVLIICIILLHTWQNCI